MVDAQTLHLLRRASYGPTPASIRQATRLGRKTWLERQLSPSSIPDPVIDAVLTRFPELNWPISRVISTYRPTGVSWEAMRQLGYATVARAAWSERQLLEQMVEFWSNHLNITNFASETWTSRAHYDRVAIRRHALGSFDDLLVAASLHPAMLQYLNNATSTKVDPNENQGRELLELHTVGVGAGYTEADVRDSARILTGFGIDDVTGATVFHPGDHDVSAVQVLGFSSPNSSAADGAAVAVAYLRYLAHHRATAAAISHKLAVRFVADDPPQSLVKALTATYLKHDTAIVPVLRQLFHSAEFAAAAGRKVRRPYEDLIATVRVLELGPDSKGTTGIKALYRTLNGMGQAPLYWSAPDGYPDVAPAWQSAAGTLARWNAHFNLATRTTPKTLTGPALHLVLPAKLPATHGELLDLLAKRILLQKLTAKTKVVICRFLSGNGKTIVPSTPLTRHSALVGSRLPHVVALLLDSPLHALR